MKAYYFHIVNMQVLSKINHCLKPIDLTQIKCSTSMDNIDKTNIFITTDLILAQA